MAKVVTDNKYYQAIADAIRALTGSSSTYTPAQMAPAIIGYIAGGIDLSDVESYFITDVVNAMNYVKELGTTNWVHHIITTDNHFVKNYGHSTAIVKAMQDSGYFSKVINLGDVSDTDAVADYTEAIANYGQFNGNMLFAIGNHDVQVADYETVFYNAFLSQSTDLVFEGGSTNFNYYWDDSVHHIRYIVFNYGSQSGGADYAIARMKDAPSGYSVITLCHYRNQIQNSALVPMIGHQLNYIGNINGHHHIDIAETAYGGQYNDVTLSNDGWANDKEPYIKVDGTDRSQAITIMSINTTTKMVKFYRIGMPTSLGQNWQYTYVQGGSLEYWESGYYWNLGYLSASETCFYCTKLFPASDSGGNITYRFYSRTGAITRAYVIGMNASGDFETGQRLSAAASAIWNNIGFLTKNASGTTPWKQAVVSFLLSVNSDGNIASVDDIVVTTDPVPLGVSYDNVTWESGNYINSSGVNTADENGVLTYGFDILPSTTYHFYIDEADWSTSFMWAYLYGNSHSGARDSIAPNLLTRKGSSNSGTTEITFSTTADTRYCRISVRNVANVIENWQSKCHLEVVTS